MIKSPVLGLTLAVCCILVTCSQARRISQRHDVAGPHEVPSLDMSGWRPVVDSGRPKLEQVAVSPTGYDGDSELVPPPRRNPINVKVKKIRPQQQNKGIVASETRISTAFTALPPEPSSKRPVRFPDEKRRPVRRHRPVGVHLRPHVAQESSQHHVRFRPSPPAPEHIWGEPTEASVGYFTPQHYNDGHLQLAIASQDQRHPISTQQVFGNPAFFNLEQPIRRPQDNTYLEPSIHENEVLQGAPLREVVPKYQIIDPSSPTPRRRRPTRPPTTEESSYFIDPDMHRSPAVHDAPAWSTEQSLRPRRPKPTPEATWQPQEVQEEEVQEAEVLQMKPARPPAPVQEQLEDDVEQPTFKMKSRKPIASPPIEEQYHQEERITLRPRRPRPTPQPVVQEDLEQEVSSPRPRTEEETARPLKRRRPRPPGDAVGQRRRRPRPRPQAPEPEVEEQQQQPEEERDDHRQPIQNWPTKISPVQEAEVTQENYSEIKEEHYPLLEEIQNQQQHQQHQHHIEDQQVHHEHAHDTYPEEVQSNQPVQEVPYAESSDEVYEQHPVSEEVNHQEPNEVTSTETLFSIPPKKKRPDLNTAAVASTTSTSTTSTTTEASSTSVITDRLRAKLNQTRPRFSLNNIKERLRQQQKTEQKDEQPAANTETSRGRFRIGSSTTTEVPTTERSTFRPSMSRFTRPPFNSRYRSTTEPSAAATTTDQMVTRRANPDIYSQNKERRPNLRRRTTETPMTTTEEMEEQDVEKETESITEEMVEMTTILPVSSTTPEDFSYAKRVTDLTSSGTAFNPLSFFSAVPANGKHASQLRFTMATEDPILPIEAFFPTFTSSPFKPHGE